MTETYPTDAQLSAMSGASDPEQEVLFVPIGQTPYYTSFYKMLWRLLNVSRRAGDLRVYKDGDLTYGVRAGSWLVGDTLVSYAGSSGNALTNNAANYIYLTAAGTLTRNTSGFPAASATPHIPLAVITTAAGGYSIEAGDLVDRRAAAMFTPPGLAGLETRCGVTAGAEANDKRTVTVQARDAADNALAGRFLIHFWIAAADYGAPDATGNTVSVTTGTTCQTLTANANYAVVSDANGKILFDLTISGAATRFVLAEIDGRVHSSGALAWSA